MLMTLSINRGTLLLLKILTFVSATPKKDFYYCKESPGEMKVSLHRSSYDHHEWFMDVVVPLQIIEGSFDSLAQSLKKDFYHLCVSQQSLFIETNHKKWNVYTCTNDLLEQSIIFIEQKCIKTRTWQNIQLELTKLAIKINTENNIEEDFTKVNASTVQCNALRQFNTLFLGSFSSALSTLRPLSNGKINPDYYHAIKFLKSDYGIQHQVKSWSDLSYYALASVEYTVGAGRWNMGGWSSAYHDQSKLYIMESDGLFNDKSLETYDEQIRRREIADINAIQSMFKLFPNYSNLISSSSSSSSSIINKLKNRTRMNKLKPDDQTSTSTSTCNKLLKVVTVVSENGSKLNGLKRSIEHAGPCVELEVLITAATYEDWYNDWKPRVLYEYLDEYLLKNHHSDVMMLFVDGYDVLLSPNIGDLQDKLNNSAPITFAAERSCWPDPVLCKWFNRAPFLNAGVFAGMASDILNMLQVMQQRYGEFAYCGEDQRAYQRFALDHPELVALDESSDVFQCMHGYNWHVQLGEGGLVSLSEVQQGVALESMREPLVMHFNAYDGKQMMQALVDGLGYS